MSDYKRLMSLANDMRAFSHVPYSNFRVGAVLVGKSGKEYTGCNVETRRFADYLRRTYGVCKSGKRRRKRV